MENSRQKAFQKLRPPCIELSSIALKFRGQQASVKSLLQALGAFHSALVDLGQLDILDERLAEYAFFPLSNVFNESQRLSSRCLEVAVQCLQILISRGWRQKLQPEMGKQLLILLSLLAGGSPTRPQQNPPSEELISACFECMDALFNALAQADRHIFGETGAKTIVDQNIYLLLEAITESPSESVQLSAIKALHTLLSWISSRVILASLLPRTVSALTKALRPTTQMRRTHRVLVAVLVVLGNTFKAVLADEVALHQTTTPIPRALEDAEESTILDEKWLKATASQVKLALASALKLRNNDRPEVQHALFEMCLLICEECSKTLFDSLQLIIETMVTLANGNDDPQSVQEMRVLKHLILSNDEFADLLSNSLNLWINALPRLMQGNDDRPKRQFIRQISTAVQIVLETARASDRLNDSLATSLVESVSTAVEVSYSKPLQAVSEVPRPGQLVEIRDGDEDKAFQPLILAHKSQLDSMVELEALISRIRGSAIHESLTRSILARIGQSSGNQQLSALWLSINFLRLNNKPTFSISDLINVSDESFDTTPYLISDLYSITLPLLLDRSMASSSNDWRLSALAVESIILQATQLGKSYRPELIDTLYPILCLLGFPEPRLQAHAMTALRFLATACEYLNTAAMLVENVDYLINSIALKLNTFDISPQGPQVLLMMLRLCGTRLLPYLDDMIDSIFAALDSFHGYPQLVELLFEVLGVVVDEAAKNPMLAITSGTEEPRHRKTAYRPSTMEDILADIRAHESRKERRRLEAMAAPVSECASQPAPHRPWTSELDGPENLKQNSEEQDSNNDDGKGPQPSQSEDEKEKPLSKPHNLLLSIARSTIPHLSSPSPRVRLTLLQLLNRISPILARHENSFLPLVNDIWPAILPRLFSLESKWTAGREQEEQGDPAYINIAAADTIAAICIGAGDFMSGRIEDIFPRLERLYRKVWGGVEKDRQRLAQHHNRTGRLAISADHDPAPAGSNLRGTVDLRVMNPSVGTTASSSSSSTLTTKPSPFPTTTTPQLNHPTQPHHLHRTSTSQIHTSLTTLLTTLLTHVHIPHSTGDSILVLLSPIMDDPGCDAVREALETWNADAVWVVRETGRIEREMREGKRECGDWRWKGKGSGKPDGVIGEREREVGKPETVVSERGEMGEFKDVVF